MKGRCLLINFELKTPCQCSKCGAVFDKDDLVKVTFKNRIFYNRSPCCKSSYSVLDEDLDEYFHKFLYINNDPKYYRYKKGGN